MREHDRPQAGGAGGEVQRAQPPGDADQRGDSRGAYLQLLKLLGDLM